MVGCKALAKARECLERAMGRPAALATAPPENERRWRAYGRLAAAQGLDRLYLVLSFDCDRPEDSDAVERVDAWLTGRGIPRTYAVPGAVLTAASGIYRRLAENGACFLNHGGRPHAEFREGRYWSITFYDRFDDRQAAEDIQAGHDAVTKVTGQTPVGFRAPHFGLLKTTEQREKIYGPLRRMGYRFSSSSLPELALDAGPVIDVGGLVEIPCSGSWAWPTVVLDSWSHIRDPHDPFVTPAYGEALAETALRLAGMKVGGVLNWYADPSHLIEDETFPRALDRVLAAGVRPVGFEELIERARVPGA